MLDELINEYVDRFHQNVPFELLGRSDKELTKILKKCLQDGKPYESDLNPYEALY